MADAKEQMQSNEQVQALFLSDYHTQFPTQDLR